jgi:ABC-type phosphate/phosphonate transport system substrate-binding protein
VIKEIKIIAQSPSMPTNVLCLSKTLSPEIKTKIINALLDMENDPFGENILKKMKFKRFIRAYEDNFLPVYRLLYEIHEKPETYDYKISDKLQ